jgi:hypothetical protein
MHAQHAQDTPHTPAQTRPAVVMPGGALSALTVFAVRELARPLEPVTADSFLADITGARAVALRDTKACVAALEAAGYTVETLEECPRERQPHLAYLHVRMVAERRSVEWHSDVFPGREVLS